MEQKLDVSYLKGLELVVGNGLKDEIIDVFNTPNEDGLGLLLEKVTMGQLVANSLANKITDKQMDIIGAYYTLYFIQRMKDRYGNQITPDIESVLRQKFAKEMGSSLRGAVRLGYKNARLANDGFLDSLINQMNVPGLTIGDTVSEISKIINISVSDLYDRYYLDNIKKFEESVSVHFGESAIDFVEAVLEGAPEIITLDIVNNWELNIEASIDKSRLN